MIHLQPSRLSESKSAAALDARLRRIASFTSSSTSPARRMSPAIAVAGLIIPPPPAMPPPDIPPKQNNVDKDPDITAKTVLREITHEIEQLMASASHSRSTEEDESLLRMLSEKYVRARLVRRPFDTSFTASSLQKLTPTQHEVLQNLLRLPEKQLLKLPKAQLELVHFAKRYDKLVKATPDQLRHLPIEHQQLVRSMQQQQKQLRTSERR
ncbi:hypothetical protein PHMEG_0006073 [Phytophthora megakarya]|uniref:Uncharacterized protein n=1 Tax=Phytophthora megakarya TaxID=4795 RepID=A0A225WQ21_9STRA|nr:hypothetical protein PHMEG_0006073 [Phytophthora megakarya]